MADASDHVRKTDNEYFTATVTAHEDQTRRLFVVRLTAKDRPRDEAAPLALALVLDRSGSMDGAKLAATREAAARVVRGLRPIDRVAVVAYDHTIQVLSESVAPNPELADHIARLKPGGWTALYEGWLTGARLLPAGARIVLLSDGLANRGRYTSAQDLAQQAGITLRQFGKTTTTIGVGTDYDEALMAAMATAGGGSHYFCRTADSILAAFAQERIQTAETVLWDVVLRAGARDVPVGYVLAGETRPAVVDDASLETPLILSFRTADGERREVALERPGVFASDPEAGAYWLAERAARLEDAIGGVHSRAQAEELTKPLRDLLLEITCHPLVDGPVLGPVRLRLAEALDRLHHLARHYDESEAMLQRKMAFASSARTRNPGKGFDWDPSAQTHVRLQQNLAYGVDVAAPIVVDPRAFELQPPEYWIAHEVAPVVVTDQLIEVVVPGRGYAFQLDEIGAELGVSVRMARRLASPEEIRAAILAAAGRSS